MFTEKIIEKYLQLIETERFLKYEKDFARKIQIGLWEGYQQSFYEPEMVSCIERIIDNVNRLSTSVNGFSISTNSIFIHGNKSQVEFEYYGNKTQRELGDLIFIISIVYNNKKHFEKFTIAQFKRSTRIARWYFNRKDNNGKYPDKEQLYLLARFPTFKGATGSIIPNKEYSLPNYSNCLGSYGLLYKPADFAFASAKIVEIFLRNNKNISMKNISSLTDFYEPLMCLPPCWKYAEKLFHLFSLWHKLYEYCFEKQPFFLIPNFLPVLGNSIRSYNVHEFTSKYLRAMIGELTFACEFIYNRPAFQFLQDLIRAIEKKASEENKYEIIEFVKSFKKYIYEGGEGGEGREGFESFEYRGGGIGIIHTVVNLGEGE